jgi:hypothetical protein
VHPLRLTVPRRTPHAITLTATARLIPRFVVVTTVAYPSATAATASPLLTLTVADVKGCLHLLLNLPIRTPPCIVPIPVVFFIADFSATACAVVTALRPSFLLILPTTPSVVVAVAPPLLAALRAPEALLGTVVIGKLGRGRGGGFGLLWRGGDGP